MQKFNFKAAAITLRTSINASINKWAGLFYDGKDFFLSKEYDIHIVDRVGAGDSFAGGLIYSLINKKEPQSAIEFAVASGCLKHSIEGDFNMVTKEEVESIASGSSSGRIQR